MSDQSLPFYDGSTALAIAPVDRVFAHMDDPKAMAAHMGESSMMMMGSRMSIEVDAGGGRVIGSKIRMHGSMMGIGVYARWCTKQVAGDAARHFKILN